MNGLEIKVRNEATKKVRRVYYYGWWVELNIVEILNTTILRKWCNYGEGSILEGQE